MINYTPFSQEDNNYFQAIHDWYLGSDGSHRKLMALYGYTGLHLAKKDEIRACDVVQSMETSSQQAQFDMQLQQYQVNVVSYFFPMI